MLKKQLIKIIAVLAASAAVLGCISPGSGSGALYAKAGGLGDSVYYARTPSAQSRERELSDCLFRVAAQIAMRKQVLVRYTVTPTNVEGVNRTTTTLDYDQSRSMEILEKLTVVQVEQTDWGTSAVVRYAEREGASPSIPSGSGANGLPAWIQKTESDRLFYKAVGSVAQTQNPGNGFQSSDMDAFGVLASVAGRPVRSGSASVYEVTLRGAYIARRWHDPSTNRYYSLAVMPR